VQADYFAQDQYKELNPEARILDDLGELSPRSTQTELRSLLGCFLFSEDDVFKKIGVLSGGERGRYALLRLLLHPANFLLLDEPTNHLDLRAKDILLHALMAYTGTVVFVSHDRYFIDKLATRVFEIGDGKVQVFPGNYEDYLWRKQGGQHVAPTLDDVPDVKPTKTVAAPFLPSIGRSGDLTPGAPLLADVARSGNGDPVAEGPKKRLNPIKRKQMEDRVRELEEEIGRVEAAIAHCETELQNFVSAEESQHQVQELAHHKADHAALLKEWEELAESLQLAR
jgi:ATP-binding cassette subfamily F protein 3